MPDVGFSLPGSSSGSSGGGGKKSPALKKLTSKPMLIGIVIVAIIALVLKSRGGSGGSSQVSEDPFAGYPTLGSGGSGSQSNVDIETFRNAIEKLKENDAEQNAMMQDAFNMQLGAVTDSFSQQMQSMRDMYSQQPDYASLFGQLLGQMGRQSQSYQTSYSGSSGNSYYEDSSPSNSTYRPNTYAPDGDYSRLNESGQAAYRDTMDEYLRETNGTRQDLISGAINGTNSWNDYREYDAYKAPDDYYRDNSTGNLEHTVAYWDDMITRREKMIDELISEGKANDPYTKLMIEDMKDTKQQRDNAKR